MVAKHTKPTHKIPDKMQQQREAAEAAARAKALKAFTPAEEDEPAAVPVREHVEPSLEQRLADIDRRARERAADEKKQLAMHYVTEARHKFRRAVANTTDENVRLAFEEMNKMERLAGDAATANGSSTASNGDGEPTARRERRSPEALKADAEKLVDYLRGNPNSKASSVLHATGVVVKPPLNVRTYIEKYLPNVKVRTEGQRVSTTYSIG
jgi:hypothetical protein